MANLLTSGLAYNPYFYAVNGLRVLYSRLGMAFYVDRSLEADKGSAPGDTVQVRRAQTFAATSMPIAEASFADVTPNYDSLVINQWQGQGFKLTDKEKSLTPEQFIKDHITPVAAAIATQIDANLTSLTLEVPWEVAADGTNPFNDFPNGRKQLFVNKAPIVDPVDYSYMTDGVLQQRYESNPTFLQANTAGTDALQRAGQLGIKFGFKIFPNQNTTTYTSGVGALTSPVTTAADTQGANVLVVTGTVPSGTFNRGTIVQIAGDPQQYAVTANTAAATTTNLPIAPNLQKNDTGGLAVTFLQTSRTSLGLMFHREAFALVMQPLQDAGPGILTSTATDPITGITLRARIWGSGGLGATIWSLDALWGYKTLNGNLAVRVGI